VEIQGVCSYTKPPLGILLWTKHAQDNHKSQTISPCPKTHAWGAIGTSRAQVRTPSETDTAFCDSNAPKVQDACLPSGSPEKSKVALKKSFEVTSHMAGFYKLITLPCPKTCAGGLWTAIIFLKTWITPRQSFLTSSSLRLDSKTRAWGAVDHQNSE
jgi:hypothetical protein